MNKLIIYVILLILYLGLSKSLSPSEFGIKYVNSQKSLALSIPGAPVSVILTDIHSTGFIIKTYYHKYKVVYGFQSFEELIIRTSRKYMEENLPYLGMSVFRRFKLENKEDFTPLPPGSVFVGDYNFGNWVDRRGKKQWRFFRVYRQIPTYLGWKDFQPTFQTYTRIRTAIDEKKPFFGSNDEFGINGSITKVSFPKYFERQKNEPIDLEKFIKAYLNENFIK